MAGYLRLHSPFWMLSVIAIVAGSSMTRPAIADLTWPPVEADPPDGECGDDSEPVEWWIRADFLEANEDWVWMEYQPPGNAPLLLLPMPPFEVLGEGLPDPVEWWIGLGDPEDGPPGAPDLDCWPEPFRTPEGFGDLYCAWYVEAVAANYLESLESGPSILDYTCGNFESTFISIASDVADVSEFSGIPESKIKLRIAAKILGGVADTWDSFAEDFCEEVLTCLRDDLEIPPTQSELALIQTEMTRGGQSATLADCDDYCNEPEGDPKRWGELPPDLDFDHDGIGRTCSDLAEFMHSAIACYPAPGEEGTFDRDDFLVLVGEFIVEADVASAGDCVQMVSCANEIAQHLPTDAGPLSSEEIIGLFGADGDCPPSVALPDLRNSNDPPGLVPGDCRTKPVGGGCERCPCVDFCNVSSVLSNEPVDLRYGAKVEQAVDLTVSLAGGSFVLSRNYRSDPSWSAPVVSGNKWAFNIFGYSSVDNDELQLGRGTGMPTMPPLDVGADAELEDVGGRLELDGSTHQFVACTVVEIDGTTYPIYRLGNPGEWEVDFLRAKQGDDAGGTIDPDAALVGLPIQERDAYGNVHTYSYVIFDDSPDVARLSRLYLNGTPDGADVPDAEVWFDWILSGANAGRLRSAQVVRWVGEEDPVKRPQLFRTW